MQQKDFAVLCKCIKRAFNQVNGAIARCFGKKGNVSVCAGTASNDKLVAESVTVWDDSTDASLYKGPLSNPELRKVLTAAKVCGAEITNSAMLGNHKTGEIYCFGDFDKCTKAECPYKKGKKNAQQATV